MTSSDERDALAVLDGVSALLPTIEARTREAEQLRRLPEDTLHDLVDVGFFRLLQPRQWGGLECRPGLFHEAVRRLASACGSTGWVSSILGVHNWHLALFDQRAQDDVWAADTTARLSSSYTPFGSGRVVEGGYLVTGEWQWSTGCDHATWALVGGPVIKDGVSVDFGSFLIPRDDYQINDVWHVVGLRGSGTNTLVLGEVFVPRHRFLSYAAMNDGLAAGLRSNRAALYKMPWGTMHPTTITAPIVGMAFGAYGEHLAAQAGRIRVALAGERAIDDPFAKIRIAEVSSDIDAAWRQLIGNVDEGYQAVLDGTSVPFGLRLRARRDQVRATGRAIASIDRLFESAGASAVSETAPPQRFWRDAHAGRVHAANDPERAYEMFGDGEFGLPVRGAMV